VLVKSTCPWSRRCRASDTGDGFLDLTTICTFLGRKIWPEPLYQRSFQATQVLLVAKPHFAWAIQLPGEEKKRMYTSSISVNLSVMPVVGSGRRSCLKSKYSRAYCLQLFIACSGNAHRYCPCFAEQVVQTRRCPAARSELYVRSTPMVHAPISNGTILELRMSS
jgi:hypothetical protein